MSLVQRGTVIELSAEQKISDKFTKRDIVVRTQDQYPQEVVFEVTNKRLEILDPIGVGDLVDVSFNLEGRLYNGRRYNNVRAWKVEVVSKGTSSAPVESAPMPTDEVISDVPTTEDISNPDVDTSDLPF
jgi:hypothetical protein